MSKLNSGWIVAIALFCFACPAEKKEPKKTPEAAASENVTKSVTKAPPKPPTIPEIVLPPGDGPAAKVGDVEIPRTTFNKEYKQTLERYYRARHDVKPALMERLKDNIVRRLVDAELIRQHAKKMGVALDEKEFGEKWGQHKERYGTAEGFKAFLDRAGTTEEDVERQFRQNLLREKVFAKISDGINADDKEVAEFYKKNEKRYQEPEKVKASHILLKSNARMPQAQRDKAKARADEALKKVKGGSDFATVAKEYSEDNTRDRGGDLGFFIKGRMVKPFEDAVWPAKVGAIIGPVETQFGYHVIKKTDHQKARKRPLAEVKDQIRRSLQARKRNQAIRDSLETWRKETKIERLIKGDPKVLSQRPQTFGRKLKPMSKNRLEVKQLPPPTTDDTPSGK